MKTLALIGIVLAGSAHHCGPVAFTHPIVDPAKSKPDPKLLGTWAGHEDKMTYVLFIEPNGATQVDLTMVAREQGAELKQMSWSGLSTKIGARTFLSLAERQTDDLPNPAEGFILVRYAVEGDSLKLEYLEEDALEAADAGSVVEAETPVVSKTIERLPAKAFSRFLTFKRVKLP